MRCFPAAVFLFTMNRSLDVPKSQTMIVVILLGLLPLLTKCFATTHKPSNTSVGSFEGMNISKISNTILIEDITHFLGIHVYCLTLAD